MGKSTAMKHVAITWANGNDLQKFQFVFHVSLKFVKDDIPLENIIVAQHKGLKAKKVGPSEIKTILESESERGKVLLLLDGHDEYRTGINTDIDSALQKENVWNCWIILTSRETEQLEKLKRYMNAEVEIHGFDEQNVKEYITKSLRSKEKADKLLQQARRRELCRGNEDEGYYFGDSLLRIPILLNMICVLFLCNDTLPTTRTGIIKKIVDRCIDRETIRRKGERVLQTAKRALVKLGKLAWEGLNEPGKRLYFEKVNITYYFKFTTNY